MAGEGGGGGEAEMGGRRGGWQVSLTDPADQKGGLQPKVMKKYSSV